MNRSMVTAVQCFYDFIRVGIQCSRVHPTNVLFPAEYPTQKEVMVSLFWINIHHTTITPKVPHHHAGSDLGEEQWS